MYLLRSDVRAMIIRRFVLLMELLAACNQVPKAASDAETIPSEDHSSKPCDKSALAALTQATSAAQVARVLGTTRSADECLLEPIRHVIAGADLDELGDVRGVVRDVQKRYPAGISTVCKVIQDVPPHSQNSAYQSRVCALILRRDTFPAGGRPWGLQLANRSLSRRFECGPLRITEEGRAQKTWVVEVVCPDGVANRAGIMVGDVVEEVNGVRDGGQFAELQACQSAEVVVVRRTGRVKLTMAR